MGRGTWLVWTGALAAIGGCSEDGATTTPPRDAASNDTGGLDRKADADGAPGDDGPPDPDAPPPPKFLCTPDPTKLETDTTVRMEPALPVLPKAGGTFVDPTFETTIMRITDPTDGKVCNNAYSYWPTFNWNSTRLFVACDGTARLYDFDPVGLKLSGKRPLYPAPSERGAVGWEDAIWSGKEADVIHAHAGLALFAFDVVKGEYTMVRDFAKDLPAGHLAQMSRSLDDDTFAFTRQTPGYTVAGYFAWRRSTDKFLTRDDTTDLDEVQVDKTGGWLVVKTGKEGAGVVQALVVNLETGKAEPLKDDGPDYAPGHSDNGAGSVLGADNWRNQITFRKLASPHSHTTVLDLKSDWSQDYHVSMLGEDDGWVTLSFYRGNMLANSGLFLNEILQVATDGSKAVRRIAHHRSDYLAKKEYWDTPRANVSRDGCFITFTSNWDGSGRRDVFVAKVGK